MAKTRPMGKTPWLPEKTGEFNAKNYRLEPHYDGVKWNKPQWNIRFIIQPETARREKGWLQQMRDDMPSHVMNGAHTQNKIKVGKGQSKDHGYENIDALVLDAVNTLIDEVYADDTELVVICGREILNDKYFNMINTDLKPTDDLASQVIISQKQIGGLKAIRVPFFPKNSILITRLDNLSIYIQEGSMRRFIKNNPKRNRVEDYLSQNIDYKVEEYGCAALIENITFEDKE